MLFEGYDLILNLRQCTGDLASTAETCIPGQLRLGAVAFEKPGAGKISKYVFFKKTARAINTPMFGLII